VAVKGDRGNTVQSFMWCVMSGSIGYVYLAAGIHSFDWIIGPLCFDGVGTIKNCSCCERKCKCSVIVYRERILTLSSLDLHGKRNLIF
jgi:hypothetical protein